MTIKLLPMSMAALFAATTIAGAAEFMKVDTNADGWVTPEEFSAANPDATEEDFAAIDANGDGAISSEEMAAYEAAQTGNTSG